MKFKISQFTGYNKDCTTVKNIKEEFKNKQFTLEELSRFLGETLDYVTNNAIAYAKTKELKQQILEEYFIPNRYTIDKIKKLKNIMQSWYKKMSR